MKYYVKIGKMYVNELSTSDECYSTMFISRIDLRPLKSIYTKPLIVKEEDISYIETAIRDIFEDKSYTLQICFEEVLESEKENE